MRIQKSAGFNNINSYLNAAMGIGFIMSCIPIQNINASESGVLTESVVVSGQNSFNDDNKFLSTVKGVVTDINGEPIIGATIAIKDSNLGTVTDYSGAFILENVNKNSTLNISYLGYKTLNVQAVKDLLVSLEEENKILNEIVVVGYGNVARKDVTSSITTIKSDDLNKGVYSNAAQMLQGKVPGLNITQSSNPNSSPSITLRGASTLRTGAAMEPYYIVDGVPGVSVSMISAEDIESIDVLRDASATAIYGSKAANGVIIVTTKKGKKNMTQVSYSGYVAFDKVAANLDMMDGDEYRDFIVGNSFSLDPSDDYLQNTDWQSEVQRTGISTNHNVTIIGGGNNSTYNASINYIKNQGVIKGTDMERYIARSGVKTSVFNDRLELAINVNASVTQQNDVPDMSQGKSVYDAMNYYLPLSPVKNDDGSWFERSSRSQYFNPVSLIEENTYYTKIKKIYSNAKGSFAITEDLKLDLDLAYINENFNYNKYYSTKSLLEADGLASRASVENEKKSLELYFNYNKSFGSNNKIVALLGYSWEESNNNDGFQATTTGFYSDDLLYHNLGMGNNVIIDEEGFGNYFLSTLRMISFFGRVNYSYASKYLLQATVRRDGSSAFGRNNRWATFPSASLAWRLSEESFINDLNIFSDLKLRAGYGVSGNSLGFDAFTTVQRYGTTGWFTNSEGNIVHTLGPIANANPDLKWEKTSMINVGLDFGFFNNRLSVTVEYYTKDTKDLIYNYPVSTTQYIYGILTANVGKISNKGIEVSINAVPVQNRDFRWNTSLNLSHNKNVVKKISNSEFSVDYIQTANLNGAGQSDLNVQRIMEGSPIGQFYTWEWAGYDENGVSVFNDYDEDGNLIGITSTPDAGDQRCTGSAQPKLVGGWNNSFTYKNFILTVFMQGVVGNKIMNATRARYSNIHGNAGNINILKDVLSTEKITDSRSHYLSDRYLENGDYLRLSTLGLSYDFGKIGNNIKNLQIYSNVNNLFVLTKYKGLDPEVYMGGLTPGIDNRQTYPRTRTFMIGANITF